ncbi:alpha/beta hydrolase-fold protein [Paraflavitalea pollutisoli]|uniref:alpha/beta hydrolase-fold protein n=1 Tax=Paraflavitalea pollutisoli TaxID=3034143 RepID=UPI0023EBCC2F|nr:alpha/beta hydrolase-fold protein [Paraflavitalea sp. H1-2-19X]
MKRLLTVCLLLLTAIAGHAQAFKIYVHLDTAAHLAQTGRLYVFSVTDTAYGVQDPDPFRPTPSFYKDVRNWQPGTVQEIDGAARAYPIPFDQLKPGFYKFAAILDVDTIERNNTTTPGNWYSRDVKVEVRAGNEAHIHLARQIPQRPFRERDSIKLVNFRSALLSKFHRSDRFIKAGVVLPASYSQDTNRRYPVVFIIPGWGGTHYDILGPQAAQRYGIGTGKDKIYVYLNPETQTRFGLHAFVDSRVNGPWGKALVEELIPHLTSQYRIDRDPLQHFVMGQSSGGYGALWLQLNYPKSFGGCWAVSPDPVDFSNFTGVDLYEPGANLYVDKTGAERPFFIVDGKPLGTLKKFVALEDFLGDGGQLQSFEAEFGVPDKQGRPQLMYNRATGAIDPKVVATWQAYDLGRFLLTHYKKLAKDLDQKVHVYAGADDNFFLDKAVLLFREKAARVNAAMAIELFPGANHWTIWNPAFTQRVQREIDQRIK